MGKLSSIQTSVLRGMCLESESRRSMWVQIRPQLLELTKLSLGPVLADRVEDEKYFEEVVETVAERVEKRSEILSDFLYFWVDPDPEVAMPLPLPLPLPDLPSNTSTSGSLSFPLILVVFRCLLPTLRQLHGLQERARKEDGGGEEDDAGSLDSLIEEARKAAKTRGAKSLSKGAAMKLLRVALTGKDGGPSLAGDWNILVLRRFLPFSSYPILPPSPSLTLLPTHFLSCSCCPPLMPVLRHHDSPRTSCQSPSRQRLSQVPPSLSCSCYLNAPPLLLLLLERSSSPAPST
eukprot:768618-Hanusia_phi.AAC.1